MVVNRYTQLTPAQYNPMSLQELMLVPQMKRTEHDNLLAAASEAETALAQADSLVEHSPLVKAEQERLYNMIDQQTQALSDEGFTHTSKPSMMRLNKEYQNSIGPNGPIGKAQMIKQQYETTKEQILANAAQEGHSASATQERLQEAYNKYFEGWDGKTLENIPLPHAPKYVDLQKTILQMGQATKPETIELIKSKGYSFEPRDGQLVLVNRAGQRVTDSNIKGINHMIDYVNQEFTNGMGGASAEWNGLDKNHIAKQINSGLLGQIGSVTRDDMRESASLINTGNGTDKVDPVNPVYSSPNRTTPLSDNYQDVKTQSTTLKESDEPKNVKTAREYDKVLREADQTLRGDTEYNRLLTNVSAVNPIIEKIGADLDEVMNTFGGSFFKTRNDAAANSGHSFREIDGKIQFGKVNPDNRLEFIPTGQPITKEEFSALKEAKGVYDEMAEYRDNVRDAYVSENGMEAIDFEVPFDKSSEHSLELLNSARAFTANNSKPTTISYIGSDGKPETLPADNPDVARSAMEHFQNADQNSIQRMKLRRQGSDVGLLVRFKPGEATIDPNGRGDWDFDGSQSLEMFIPITNLKDSFTGNNHSTTQFIDSIRNEELKKEARKFIYTSDLSGTYNEEELGQSKVPATKYFNEGALGITNEDLIDFKIEEGDNDNNYYIPHIINKDGKPKTYTWDNVLGNVAADERSQELLLQSGLLDELVDKSSKNYTDGSGRTYFDIYKLGNKRERDLEGFFRAIQHEDIRLSDPSSLLEVANFSNNL